MAGMGPPPKHPSARARRNASPHLTALPAAGRGTKRAPAWPLQPDVNMQVDKQLADAAMKQLRAELKECTDARVARRLRRELEAAQRTNLRLKLLMTRQAAGERKLWGDLWRTPQATQWEQLGWVRDVAQYVRHKVRAEAGSLDDAKEARQWSDRLGLNPLAMLRLRWETERVEEVEQRGRERRARGAAKPPAKKAAGADPRTLHLI